VSVGSVEVDGVAVGQPQAMSLRVAGADVAPLGTPGFVLHFVADAVIEWAPLAVGGTAIKVRVTTVDTTGQPHVVYELNDALVTSLENRWTGGGSPSIDVALSYAALVAKYKDGVVVSLPPSR
jgi:hypothetical protein